MTHRDMFGDVHMLTPSEHGRVVAEAVRGPLLLKGDLNPARADKAVDEDRSTGRRLDQDLILPRPTLRRARGEAQGGADGRPAKAGGQPFPKQQDGCRGGRERGDHGPEVGVEGHGGGSSIYRIALSTGGKTHAEQHGLPLTARDLIAEPVE